jgi:FkbM family methyltransferase
VVRFQATSHWLARRQSLLRAYRIDLVLDVGANDGEYGRELRRLGYRGQIISFEPLPDASARLRRAHDSDSRWRSYQVALGEVQGTAEFHVAANSSSSSLLAMLPSHERYAPESRYISVTRVPLTTIDVLANELFGTARCPFLKIDTQGSEGRVLDGASTSLERIVGLQLELSIEPLYDGAPHYLEMLSRVEREGFVLMSVEPGFSDRVTGRMLQFDALAFRPDLAQAP